MHLGVAEGDRCAPSSLFVPPETHSMFASFNRRPLHPTSHPQRHLFGKELGSLALAPPTRAWPVILFFSLSVLAESPPRRKDLHKHLLEWRRCCADWGSPLLWS